MHALQTPAAEVRQVTARAAKTSALGHARRRAALLKLARRRGEVRITISAAGRPRALSADMLDLLDELNTRGSLRYAGLVTQGSAKVITYTPT